MKPTSTGAAVGSLTTRYSAATSKAQHSTGIYWTRRSIRHTLLARVSRPGSHADTVTKQTTPWTNVPWPLWCRRCAQASGNHGPQGPAQRSDHSLRINPPHPQNGSASPGTGGCAHFQERARLSTLAHCATALTTRPGTAPVPPRIHSTGSPNGGSSPNRAPNRGTSPGARTLS